MKPMQQPVGQVRLTNVAIVRYKRAGHRFEVAAYKNKVLNWRNRIETDIDEVLQARSVFQNVSKGVAASKADLMAAFGTDDPLACALIILDKGELEVSDKERALQFDNLFRDVAATIADKCVNPETNRPYPVTLIERALREVHFAVVPGKPAKAQALKGIVALKGYMPIERARLKVRITVPAEYAAADGSSGNSSTSAPATTQQQQQQQQQQDDQSASFSDGVVPPVSVGFTSVRSWLQSMHAIIEYEGRSGNLPSSTTSSSSSSATSSGNNSVVFDAIVDPGYFRRLEEEAKRFFGGKSGALATVELLSLSALADAAASGTSTHSSSSSKGGKNQYSRSGAGGDSDEDGDEQDDDEDNGLGVSAFLAAKMQSSLSVGGSSSNSSNHETVRDGGKMTQQQNTTNTTPNNNNSSAPPSSSNNSNNNNNNNTSTLDAATLASAKGTGMTVRRVTQPGRRLACNACGGIEFAGPDEHREHHRSDLHRFNLKRKMKNMEPLTMDGFEAMPAKDRDAFLAIDS